MDSFAYKSTGNGDAVALVLEDGEIIASKKDLIEKSGYFRSMFELPMKESKEKRIVINECRLHVFKYLVDFEFDDLYFLNKDTIELIDIFTAADFFQFEKILRFLRDRKVDSFLTVSSNAWQVYARRNELLALNLEYFLNTAIDYIDMNATYFLKQDSFLSVPQSTVEHFLCRDSFAAPEDVILHSVVSYVKHNKVEQPDTLFDCVRFNIVSKETLDSLKKTNKELFKVYTPKNENCGVRRCIVKNQNFADENLGFTTGFVPQKSRKKQLLMSFNVCVLINYVKVKFNQTYPFDKKKFNVDISSTGEKWLSLVIKTDRVRALTSVDGHKFVFNETDVKFIRIEMNKRLKIESFECLRKDDEKLPNNDLFIFQEKLESTETEPSTSFNLFPISFSQLFNQFCETG